MSTNEPELPEIALPGGTRVICDLHLDLGAEAGVQAFVDWLGRQELAGPPCLPCLIVLGDLFDAWVGPAQERMPGAPPVLDALAALADRGTRVALVHGNRDFLFDAASARRARFELYPDGFVGLLGQPGRRALFVHGDELCTLDTAYQRLRRVVRSGPVRWLAPRVPLPVALGVARRLRRASTTAVARKPVPEKSMQADAADALCARHAAELLVCGHAHEYADRPLAGGARWLVLDAFGGQRDVLVIEPDADVRAVSSAASHGATR